MHDHQAAVLGVLGCVTGGLVAAGLRRVGEEEEGAGRVREQFFHVVRLIDLMLENTSESPILVILLPDLSYNTPIDLSE